MTPHFFIALAMRILLRMGFSKELVRFLIVGGIGSAISYTCYAALVALGGEPKLVVTGLFIVATPLIYLANRNWSFEHRGSVRRSLPLYCVSQVLGYFFNMLILMLCIDRLGWNPYLTQALAIVLCAAFTFSMNKWIVFRGHRPRA